MSKYNVFSVKLPTNLPIPPTGMKLNEIYLMSKESLWCDFFAHPTLCNLRRLGVKWAKYAGIDRTWLVINSVSDDSEMYSVWNLNNTPRWSDWREDL